MLALLILANCKCISDELSRSGTGSRLFVSCSSCLTRFYSVPIYYCYPTTLLHGTFKYADSLSLVRRKSRSSQMHSCPRSLCSSSSIHLTTFPCSLHVGPSLLSHSPSYHSPLFQSILSPRSVCVGSLAVHDDFIRSMSLLFRPAERSVV